MDSFRNQHIYFGGAAFATAFYIGSVRALRERYPEQTPYVHCDSAGSLVGLGYALGVPTEDIEKVYFDCINIQERRNKRIWGGKISQDHDFIINTFLKKGNFELIRRNDRFSVGVTSFFNKHTRYTNWESPGELRRFMHKSMIIPFLTKNDFAWEVDGAYSNHEPYDLCFGTLPKFDIFHVYTMWEKLTIPTTEGVRSMIDDGYRKTLQHHFKLCRNNRYNNNIVVEIASLLIMWLLKLMSFGVHLLGLIE